MFQEENFAVFLSKDVSQNMKRNGKTFSCPWFFIYPLFKKRAKPQGETHAGITNIRLEILILQICIDFISSNLANLVLAIFVNLAMSYYPKDKKIFHRNKNFHQNFNRFQTFISKRKRKNKTEKVVHEKFK